MAQPLIQFRAGRAERRGQTNWIDPQPNKGLIYLQEEDGLLHFYYKDLETQSILEDLIIFPGDATYQLAPNRISVLKFNSSSSRHFYWNQDLDASKDEEIGKRVNELIGGEEESEEEAGGMQVDPAFVTPSAPRMIPSQHSATPATVAPSAPAPAPAPAPAANLGTAAQMAQLQSILSNISGGSGASSGNQGYSDTPPYLLSDLLPPSSLTSLLSSTSPSLPRLLPHLPPSLPQTPSSLHLAISSPEFKRSLRSLERALQTGALGPLVKGLGMGEGAAMGVEGWVEGVEEQAKRELEEENKGEGKGEKMEED